VDDSTELPAADVIDTIVTVEVACAECGCRVDVETRVATCYDPQCCCRDLPVREPLHGAPAAKRPALTVAEVDDSAGELPSS
jgi:hypothetical protein